MKDAIKREKAKIAEAELHIRVLKNRGDYSRELYCDAIDKAIKAMEAYDRVTVDNMADLLAKSKSNFANPNHYSVREQASMTRKDANAIVSEIKGE